MTLTNPIRIQIEQRPTELLLKADLTPDGIGLRARFRALVVHLHNVPEPIFWDLGKNIELVQHAIPLGVPQRICTTVYGVLPDNTMHLVFRNWGTPGDGLPLPYEPAKD